MKVEIRTIPHEQQRYPTVGDWQFVKPDELVIRVSDMGNPDYAFLVGIHETIEAWVAVKRSGSGIEKALDAFDMQYENDRKEGDVSEPGDDAKCPVYLEHQIATGIERMLAGLLGVDWNTYNTQVEEL